MSVSFNFSALDEIAIELNNLSDEYGQEVKTAMKDIGNAVADEVKKLIPKSAREHKHIIDDVKVHAKTDKLGVSSVVICGGKDTGYKWHMLDDGTPTNHALHFTTAAVANASAKIESIADELIRRVVES